MIRTVILALLMFGGNWAVLYGQSPTEIAKAMFNRIPDPTYKRLRAGMLGFVTKATQAEIDAITDWNAALNDFSDKQVLLSGKKVDPKKKVPLAWGKELIDILLRSDELYDQNGRFRTDVASAYSARIRNFPPALLKQWEVHGRSVGWPSQIFHIIKLPGLFEGDKLNEDVHRRYVARFISVGGGAGGWWSGAQGGGIGEPEGEPANLYGFAAEYNLIAVSELFPNDRFDVSRFLAAYPIALEMLVQERAKNGLSLIGAVGSSRSVTVDGPTPSVVNMPEGEHALWVKITFGKAEVIDLASVAFSADYRYNWLPLLGVDISCRDAATQPPSFKLVRPVSAATLRSVPMAAVSGAESAAELSTDESSGPRLTVKQPGASVCFLFAASGKVDWYTLGIGKASYFIPLYLTNHVVPLKQ